MLARSLKEMQLAAELEPCPSCGTRDASTLALQGDGTRWFLQGPCPKCGTHRSLRFETARTPNNDEAGAFDLGPGPSQLIKPAQFLELYDRVKLRDATQVTGTEWTAAVAELRRARTCVNELLKLLPGGAAAIPGTSDRRLTRAWIEGERARLDKLQETYTAERPRIEREQQASAPPKPIGTLNDSALRAHAQWLSRGRQGEGQLVLEHHRLAGRRMGSPNFEFVRFVDCDFTDAVFGGVAIFNDADLERVTFVRAHLDTAGFKRTAIRGGNWSDATLSRTDWTHVKIDATDLSRADLSKSVWEDAIVTGAKLVGAKLTNAPLDRAMFHGCDFRDANLASVEKFPASTSRDTRFVECDLRGSDWTGRTIAGATFVRCKLAGARGLDRAAAKLEDCDTGASPSTVADELRALLAIVQPARTPTPDELREYAKGRGVRVTVAGPNLTRPAWAPGVGNAQDVFAELAPDQDVTGIRVSQDRRGIATNVQLVVRRGTLAELEAVTGKTRAMPRQSRSVEHAFADPTVAGHRIVIEIEHAGGAVKLITVRFETTGN